MKVPALRLSTKFVHEISKLPASLAQIPVYVRPGSWSCWICSRAVTDLCVVVGQDAVGRPNTEGQ